MVLLRPGSQEAVSVPQRPAETVKPRKNTIVEEKEQKPYQKTAPLGAIKCLKRL